MKFLTQYFPRVVVVNRVSRTDRRAALTANLQQTGVMGRSKPEWFDAIEPDECPVDFPLGCPGYGCTLSHLALLATIDRPTLILEDDAAFAPDALARINEFLDAVPADWSQLYLGGKHLEPSKPVNGQVCQGSRVSRAHAYAVNPQSAALILAYVADRPGLIDHRFGDGQSLKLWKAHCPVSWICTQASGLSDLAGKIRPER